MGNTTSSESQKNIKFGSINDPDNSRAGYYNNGKILKYHTTEIPLIPGEKLESFKKLNYGYAITNRRAFYQGEELLGVNPSHFGIINRNELPKLNRPDLQKLDSVLGVESFGKKFRKIYYKGKLV